MSKQQAGDTRGRLLDEAQDLAQSIGLNAFSYRDLSERLGIKTASIHYHFPKKEDLSFALIERYRERFSAIRDELDKESDDPKKQLKLYVDVCLGVMEDGLRICLCGMFATDFLTLPDKTRNEVKQFILENESWLETVLKRGKRLKQFDFNGSARSMARSIFGLLEGVIIVSHCFPDQADRQRQNFQKLVGPLLLKSGD